MNRSFWSLVVAQCQVFINDNAAKLTLMALAIAVLPREQSVPLKSFLAGLVILPFVLLSPAVGWLVDRYSKRDVLLYSQWLQLGVMLLLLAGLSVHSLVTAVFAFFLLGLQCSIFAPAKQGIIKEIVGTQKLSTAVGWIEATAINSILMGSLAGGVFFDLCFNRLDVMRPWNPNNPWDAAIWTVSLLSVLASLGIWLCSRIERTPSHTDHPFRKELLWEHFVQLREVWHDRPVRLCILGSSYFYALAGGLFLTLLEVASDLSNNGPGTATRTAVFMALLGVGTMVGHFLVSRLTLHHIELGLIPIGSAGMIVSLTGLCVISAQSQLFFLPLFALGLSGALFVVPLSAHLQDVVVPEKRGRTMTANNLVTNLTGILTVSLYYVLSALLKLGAADQFLAYAVPTALLSLYVILLLPENLLRFTIGILARMIYRVHGHELEKLPEKGGVLLVPNHISYVDAIVLQLACPRPIRFLVDETIYQTRILNWGMRLLRTIPISPKRARSAIDLAAAALKEGEVVCIFPEGALTRTSALHRINKGYELIARKSGVPVQPVWLENLWGSVFSYWGGKYFWKMPRALPYHVWVYFGTPIPAEDAKIDRVRRELYDLGQRAFSARPELESHVGYEVIKGLRHKFFRPVVIDAFHNGRTLTGGKLLSVGIVMADWVRQNIPDKRVGIILPPGLGASIVNLACVLADKTAVNLNFTAGRAANQAALNAGGIKTVITAQAVVDKLKDFPWPENRIDVVPILQSFKKSSMFGWLLASFLLPPSVVRRLAKVPRYGGHEEAGLLFTSGSAGDPKGVILSHHNVLANTAQIGAILGKIELRNILGCLPIFHSFGCTVTFWWPLLGGPTVVTYVSPLETQKLIEVIDKFKIELFLNTPTFLRAYLRKAKPEQMQSIKLVVTGAEKLPPSLAVEFEDTFQIPVCEGYGMTEATPVVSTNLPNVAASSINPTEITCRRLGSVGRPLPGLSIRIRDPETDEDRSIFESGMLWLKGANIFEGYLNDPKRTDEVLRDGWYKTGDIGRMDEDGFLYIEGRLTRFSKIGGEMVPHGTIESRIAEVMGLTTAEGEGPAVIVVGIPDDAKGEQLVALSTQSLDAAVVRTRLVDAGLPTLWIPKQFRQVEKIPLMATGKLDIRACQSLATNGQANHPGTHQTIH